MSRERSARTVLLSQHTRTFVAHVRSLLHPVCRFTLKILKDTHERLFPASFFFSSLYRRYLTRACREDHLASRDEDITTVSLSLSLFLLVFPFLDDKRKRKRISNVFDGVATTPATQCRREEKRKYAVSAFAKLSASGGLGETHVVAGASAVAATGY